MIEHGTYGGYQQHKKQGVPVCPECKEANREYAKKYRAANPDYLQRDKDRAKIRNRAMRELANRHPRELRKIIKEMS